jgi:hypothetical protein
MDGKRPPAGVAHGWTPRLHPLAQRLQLRPGEVTELLERLPVPGAAAAGGGEAPPGWGLVRRTVEAYAARKRAVARLARQGRLAEPPPPS